MVKGKTFTLGRHGDRGQGTTEGEKQKGTEEKVRWREGEGNRKKKGRGKKREKPRGIAREGGRVGKDSLSWHQTP